MAYRQSPTGCSTLARMIAHARLKKEVSQERLAALTGIKRQKLARLERGERRVKKTDLAVIEKALDVTFEGVHRLGQSRHRPDHIWCAVDLASGTPFVLCQKTGEVLFEPPEWGANSAQKKEQKPGVAA